MLSFILKVYILIHKRIKSLDALLTIDCWHFWPVDNKSGVMTHLHQQMSPFSTRVHVVRKTDVNIFMT